MSSRNSRLPKVRGKPSHPWDPNPFHPLPPAVRLQPTDALSSAALLTQQSLIDAQNALDNDLCVADLKCSELGPKAGAWIAGLYSPRNQKSSRRASRASGGSPPLTSPRSGRRLVPQPPPPQQLQQQVADPSASASAQQQLDPSLQDQASATYGGGDGSAVAADPLGNTTASTSTPRHSSRAPPSRRQSSLWSPRAIHTATDSAAGFNTTTTPTMRDAHAARGSTRHRSPPSSSPRQLPPSLFLGSVVLPSLNGGANKDNNSLPVFAGKHDQCTPTAAKRRSPEHPYAHLLDSDSDNDDMSLVGSRENSPSRPKLPHGCGSLLKKSTDDFAYRCISFFRENLPNCGEDHFVFDVRLEEGWVQFLTDAWAHRQAKQQQQQQQPPQSQPHFAAPPPLLLSTSHDTHHVSSREEPQAPDARRDKEAAPIAEEKPNLPAAAEGEKDEEQSEANVSNNNNHRHCSSVEIHTVQQALFEALLRVRGVSRPTAAVAKRSSTADSTSSTAVLSSSSASASSSQLELCIARCSRPQLHDIVHKIRVAVLDEALRVDCLESAEEL